MAISSLLECFATFHKLPILVRFIPVREVCYIQSSFSVFDCFYWCQQFLNNELLQEDGNVCKHYNVIDKYCDRE